MQNQLQQTMTQIRFKKVPFNLELAKKITNKEVKGRIVTEKNLSARIICFDMKWYGSKKIAALVDDNGCELGVRYDLDGTCCLEDNDEFNLHIEIPTYYKDYSNFEPCKWQPCLVRDGEKDDWIVSVCAGKESVDGVLFYDSEPGVLCTWKHVLPLSKITERLIGATKSYEELIKELDAKSIASTKAE